jgi:hypothetical protein
MSPVACRSCADQHPTPVDPSLPSSTLPVDAIRLYGTFHALTSLPSPYLSSLCELVSRR